MGSAFFNRLKEKQESLYLDLNLSTFQRQCFLINDLLIEKKMFLRVHELRKKFRYLVKKVLQKNQVQQDLSACFEEPSNGFEIVGKLIEIERKEMLKPLDIVYKSMSKIDQTANCCFSESMRKGLSSTQG